MSVQTEINRISTAKEAIATSIAGKGVTVPDGVMLDGMAALIESIKTGGGELQIVSGRVMPSDTGQPITVTGLNFRPKIIYISRVSITNKTKTKYLYSSFTFTGNNTSSASTGVYLVSGSSYSANASTTQGSAESARYTITDDGFSFTHPNAQSTNYLYYVIG